MFFMKNRVNDTILKNAVYNRNNPEEYIMERSYYS